MSRTSLYNQEKCCNPKCSAFANCDDELCWFGPDDDPKVFCSVLCKQHYLNSLKDINELDNLKQVFYTRKSRYKEELARVMYILLGKKISKKEIRQVIDILDLSSRYIKTVR